MHRILNLPLFVILMAIAALAMYVPAAHGASVKNYMVARPFFYSGTLFLVLSGLLALATGANRPANLARSHLLTLFGTFTLLPMMLAVPFNEAVRDTSFFNSWWEMVASLTTTGASLYAPERLDSSLHLWRAQVGWMGGFFILVMAIAVLAPLRIGGFELFLSDASERGGASGQDRSIDFQARILRYALLLFPAYAGLTLALWIGLLLAGDPAVVALCHAMSTLATSGISPLGGPGSAPSGMGGEVLIFLFLLPALSRRFWPGGGEMRASIQIRKDPELKLAALLVIVVPLVLFARHWIGAIDFHLVSSIAPISEALWGGVFTVMSFLTTTGFESGSWLAARNWSGLGTPGLILAGLAITGGGVATTASGVKLLRIYALLRHGERELELLVHPSSIAGGGLVARRLRVQGAFLSWIFFMLFALSIAVVMLAVSLTGLPFEQATIFSLAALTNTGPLAAIAGQAPLLWSALGPETKAVLAAAMVLGRLETLAIIALFNPDFWRG